MDRTKKSLTFIWKIKNFTSWLKMISSPSFLVHEKGETKWKFELFPLTISNESYAACYFTSIDNNCGPEQYDLDYELSFLDGNQFVLRSEVSSKQEYKISGYLGICFFSKDMFIPNDILTIHCRIWDNKASITQSGKYIAETCVETECITFVGIIEKFSSTDPSCQNLVRIQSSAATFLSSMNLHVTNDDKLVIEIKFANKSLRLYKYIIFIRDKYGMRIKFGHGEFHNCSTHAIPLTLSKKQLIKNKAEYLPNDVLTIECEVSLSSGTTTEKLGDTEFIFDFRDIQENELNANKTNLSSEECHAEIFTTLKEDVSSLFRDHDLCDMKLKTATETFPAHTAILGARSQVFKSIFSSEMKEKTNKCVDIDDLDAGTVRRMLLYIYTDTLDDLTCESAKSLYFAAVKYNIVSLKRRCSNFLKKNLLVSNFCDILSLADKHLDEDLKNAVQDYIAKNDIAVLFSDEWKKLEKNNSQLSTEVLRTMYLKIREFEIPLGWMFVWMLVYMLSLLFLHFLI